MAAAGDAVAGNLADLRRDVMHSVLLGLLAGIYLWVGYLLNTSQDFDPRYAAPAIALAGLLSALAMHRGRPSLAAAALVGGVWLAIVYSIWLSGIRLAPYLLATAVSLTGLFFGLQAVLAVTLVSCLLVVGLGALRFGLPPYAGDLLAPVVVISVVGLLSALTVRNLYLALHWAWDRTLAAQRNERELRERRAELVRTAKALDEACQRLEHLNYDLALAREAADEARLLKQQFTANVSHELRTPLTVIVAFAEMMYLSPQSYGGVSLPPEYLGDAREVYRASQALLRLIDDVLELSQIEAQRLRLRPEPGDIAEVIAEAVEIMRPLVRGKEIELATQVPANLPLLPMDRARVRQVLLNLLNNARRFTERGRIEVSATLEVNQVRITVADTGIGIAPADLTRVFEEFRQLDGSTTRQRDGTGLGLAISRRFVELHGGRIWVESEGIPGQGSRFHFTLPLSGALNEPTPDLQRTSLQLQPPSGHRHALLLLDTDPAAIRLLEEALPGCRIVPAGPGHDLSALLAQHRPLAALVNPANTAAARAIQPQLAGLQIPVIACPLVYERHLGAALGAAGYLRKPVSRHALATMLQRLPEGIRTVLVVDDDARMTRVLERMLRALLPECTVRRAYSGAAALREIKRQRPDLVLLDLVMPEMDGRAILQHLRADPALASLPVIVISAQDLTAAEVRRLGRRTFRVSQPWGLSNQEALAYLRGALDVLAQPSALRQRQAIEGAQEVGLGDGLTQRAGGAQ
ncbi:MAG: ATP-binding protein [Anaerolineae bacterium]